MMKITLMISLIMISFSTACSIGGSQELPTVASAPTNVPDTDNTAEESPANNDDIQPVATDDERFTIEISGDMSLTFSGFGYVSLTEEVTVSSITFPSYFDLFFSENVETYVSISMPDTITPGTYTFSGFSSPGEFGASFSVIRIPDNFVGGFDNFNNEVQGTMTLDQMGSEDGDFFSGNFEFTATMIDTDNDGQDIRKTVTVKGTFTDIPLSPG